MVSLEHIQKLISECRKLGKDGLDNGTNGLIPELEIDVVPPSAFLGVGNNPAIFVNSKTYKLMRTTHEKWVENKTIVFKSYLLSQPAIKIIGAIVHETGHAFNVAAKIPNTEANACIFEIEVLMRLFQVKSPLLLGCTELDMQSYFKSRLTDYNKCVKDCRCLAEMVQLITHQFKLDEVSISEKENQIPLLSIANKWPGLFAKKQVAPDMDKLLTSPVTITPEVKILFYQLIKERFHSPETEIKFGI
ncbi:Dot/Icm T4SS effector RavK [Legionella pneumophila serogroup 1]|uniref:Dot/Icm T4SS effector RavK n=1 Tax=Legionella pneumophila TaxID=446 RepID=UPI00048435AA|nr:Dot/Icm T4SS effector RavK [Legionella pneumophila]AMV13720.1 hypothetical protein ULM_10360 [Legionella pneumophila]ANN92022.1 hypothetical protein A9P85_05045 [Legionella pneumophila]MCH9059118.1 Dot/Icm T4SS effector RavK [Legionella pneumophila serogroup 1]MCH9062738.1 Dot/Icm T4SS effector RavK [Legionella pneumophila serogroup 1]MCH9065150.1 Dot/Icm T4SS effector RavK [Legionella pneumophila serogroup 1]